MRFGPLMQIKQASPPGAILLFGKVSEVDMNPTANIPIHARSNLTIRAKDIMTANITTVEPETTVHRIAQLLSDRHISAVLVIDRGSVVGIVSEGDLLHRQELGTEFERVSSFRISYEIEEKNHIAYEIESESTAKAKSHGMHARDVMTRKVITVEEDASLADVVRTLQDNHIRRVPVIRGAKLIGVVSRADIMRALAARPEGSHGPTSRDDDMIRYQVIETLLSIPGTSPWATTVTVSNGIVELTGSVEQEVTREPSRIAVGTIPDVVKVKDHRSIIQPY
ncbi:CBS domain-containing protein [Reyranella sp.]|uniref:CBS domain-containing protein n=1 Tax=Reyranella sp. TaxID=1929291 RepID=UPI0027301600|nr:CBS domain-containing protein [Reyranella sp.]MDP2376271.1 CBS domain-containing protein [Reyranella sp.]